ncbi:MAG: DUF4382 domain-containing protein [Candidatus Thermoplasmatota archaeon]|jgi:hypothetical protein|nr:DUF4382 domain-containing protein [Candidatus Thermoplasmatota archaeon]
MKKAATAIMALAIILIIVGGFFVYDSYIPSSNKVPVDMEVADSPNTLASAVYISFSSVELHGNKTGWTNYTVGNKTVDILGLTLSNASLLSKVTLTAQTYTMFRIFIKNVTVVIAGVSVNFTLASSFAFLNHPFTISAGKPATVVFEFNLTQDLNVMSSVFTPNVGIEVMEPP